MKNHPSDGDLALRPEQVALLLIDVRDALDQICDQLLTSSGTSGDLARTALIAADRAVRPIQIALGESAAERLRIALRDLASS